MLDEALGPAASTAMRRVVPDLGGGVRITTPRGVVDASVMGLAAFAQRALDRRTGAPGSTRNDQWPIACNGSKLHSTAAAQRVALRIDFKPRGIVQRVGDGVALVAGLDDVRFEEMLTFDSGAFGMAYDLRADGVGAILLAGAERVHAGDGVVGSGDLPDLPVGPETLGRVLDPLGNPLDEGPPLSPPIVYRCFVRRSFASVAMSSKRCGPVSWPSMRLSLLAAGSRS